MQREYDWSGELEGLDLPSLLVFGDQDMYPIEYALRFFKLMNDGVEGYTESKSRLAILPKQTHYDIVDNPLLGLLARDFLA